MEYDNELRGVLFRNDRKDKETQPDHKGNCQIDGVEYWISAWVNVKPSGRRQVLQNPVPAQGSGSRQCRYAPCPSRERVVDDDLPF